MIIELRKPVISSSYLPHGVGPTDYRHFDRGERIIIVDGMRWGRTAVRSRGQHGNVITFEQHEGETLSEPTYEGSTRFRDIYVSTGGRRNKRSQVPVPSTDEVVLAKVKELIEAGKLRHPEIVKAEVEARRASFAASNSRAQQAENERFRAKAIEAAGVDRPEGVKLYTDEEHLVARIIEAMRWAQSQ